MTRTQVLQLIAWIICCNKSLRMLQMRKKTVKMIWLMIATLIAKLVAKISKTATHIISSKRKERMVM